MTTVLRLLPAALAVGLLGCGGEERPAVHPVSGQVLYGGKPAVGVRVYFNPTSAPMIPVIPSNPHGVTGPDGKFTLSTYGTNDGAPEGGYQVVLFWPDEVQEGEESSNTDRLLGWYDASHSTLTADVKAGENVLPAFTLPSRAKEASESQGIPGRN